MVSFGTKAETLKKLSNVIEKAEILPLIKFTSKEWNDEKDKVLNKISNNKWYKTPLIVRSSAVEEDKVDSTNAGKYLSIPNVTGMENIEKSINKVFDSYDSKHSSNQVFIQPLLTDIKISGVAFSKEPSTGANQIVINYDNSSGYTDTVTSGNTNNLKTYYFFKEYETLPEGFLKKVILLVFELEEVLKTDELDIEFAITKDNKLYLLQVRPLNITVEHNTEEQKVVLENINNKIKNLNSPHPYLYGKKSIFGIMPDWNPAEIIGTKPKKLSLSLYKEIITDNIWAYQRDNYGYKNLRSFPLMVNFSGLPYIDVRISFNSFLPKDLDDELCEKLVNYYIETLINNPSYHDKVEFKIVYSCYTLDLKERLSDIKKHDFSEEECNKIEESLRKLTNRIIHEKKGLWQKDIEKINKLDKRREKISKSSLNKISKIYWLLEDCKRYGTLPFAGLARAGFIAVQLLNSLISVGILNQEEYEKFMRQLDTVNSQMQYDLYNLEINEFLKKYGHLRPGTYDILSPRYDEMPEKYFDFDKIKNNYIYKENNETDFQLSLNQLNKLQELLKKHKLNYDVLGFFEFIKKAIEGREYAKFIFTKSVSKVLSLIKDLAIEEGFSVEEAAFIDIHDVLSLYSSSKNIKKTLKKSISRSKKNFKLTKQLNLPPLIIEPDDIWKFHKPDLEPNFITQKSAIANVCFTEGDLNNLENKIILIPSADPGFDWIFSYDISGLVTMYGGVNSHMAIRAGELGIPAVIGVGKELFNKVKNSNKIKIDCVNEQIKFIDNN